MMAAIDNVIKIMFIHGSNIIEADAIFPNLSNIIV